MKWRTFIADSCSYPPWFDWFCSLQIWVITESCRFHSELPDGGAEQPSTTVRILSNPTSAVRSWRLYQLPDFYLPPTDSELDHTIWWLPLLLRRWLSAPGVHEVWQPSRQREKHCQPHLHEVVKINEKRSLDTFTAIRERHHFILKPVKSISFLAETSRWSFTQPDCRMNQLALFSYDGTFMRVRTCEPMKASFFSPSFVSLMNVCMIKLSLQTNSLVLFCGFFWQRSVTTMRLTLGKHIFTNWFNFFSFPHY